MRFLRSCLGMYVVKVMWCEILVHKKPCFSMLLERFVSGFFGSKKVVLRLFGSLGSCCLFHVGVVGLVLFTTSIVYSLIFTAFGGKLSWQR
jgi:hypothetical protein